LTDTNISERSTADVNYTVGNAHKEINPFKNAKVADIVIVLSGHASPQLYALELVEAESK
jgi:hypothetical protein